MGIGGGWELFEKVLELRSCSVFVSFHEIECRLACIDIHLLLIGFQFPWQQGNAEASHPYGKKEFGIRVRVVSEEAVTPQGVFKIPSTCQQQRFMVTENFLVTRLICRAHGECVLNVF